MTTWRLDWVTRWDDVWGADVQGVWQQALTGFAGNHVFFHPALVRAWFETPRPAVTVSPRVLVARDESLGASVVMPMARIEGGWRHLRQRLLAPVGMFEFDYHDPLSSTDIPEQARTGFWQALVGGFETSWYGSDVDRLTIPRLRRRWSCASGCERTDDAAPYIDMSNIRNLDALLARLGSRYRKSFRRELRRARQEHAVRLDVLRDAGGDAMELLARLYRLRRQRWPQAHEPFEFFANLVRYGTEPGVVHFSVLRFDDDIVSYHLGFSFEGTYYYYVPMYEPHAAKFSPGLIHLIHLLEWCIERGYVRFDFLVGMEDYKRRWASGADEMSSLTHDNPRLLSRCRNEGRRALQSLKGWFRRG